MCYLVVIDLVGQWVKPKFEGHVIVVVLQSFQPDLPGNDDGAVGTNTGMVPLGFHLMPLSLILD